MLISGKVLIFLTWFCFLSHVLIFNKQLFVAFTFILCSKWKVNNVNDMYGMFYEASSFNQDLSPWIVDKVTTMELMLYKATSYTHTLCGHAWLESKAASTSAERYTVCCFGTGGKGSRWQEVRAEGSCTPY
jgi:surface protein